MTDPAPRPVLNVPYLVWEPPAPEADARAVFVRRYGHEAEVAIVWQGRLWVGPVAERQDD